MLAPIVAPAGPPIAAPITPRIAAPIVPSINPFLAATFNLVEIFRRFFSSSGFRFLTVVANARC